MIKQKITRFVMETEEYGKFPCDLPASLLSVLMENGVVRDPYYGENILEYKNKLAHSVTFSASFKVSGDIYVKKQIYIRLHGIDTRCAVSLNGQQIGECNSIYSVYTLRAKDYIRLGENEITLTFSDVKEGKALISDAGIFSDVELVAFDKCAIDELKLSQCHSENEVTLSLGLGIFGETDGVRAVATLVSPVGQVYYSGIMNGACEIRVQQPNLWWPSGVGVQNLYKLTVNLYCDGEVEDSWEDMIGLRTLSTAENNGAALSFNGENILPFGVKYLCEDEILPRLSRERTLGLLNDAKRAGFNLIKVELCDKPIPEWLFDICDRLGIIVWLSVCEKNGASSNGLSDFFAGIAHHPSFALLSFATKEIFFENEKAVKDKLSSVLCIDNRSDISDATDKISFPDVKTLSAFASEEEMNPASFTFECHGADGDKISNALSAICDRYRLPTDISDLVFASQLAEAENTLELIASNREARDFRASVYGSLNDSYPVISDSVIDYYGRWKALAYMARGQCAPVVVTASSCGGRVVLKLSNERRYPTQGTLSYSVIDRDNRPLCSESLSVGCDALSSVTAADIDLAQIISGRERECYLYFEFSTDSEKELSKGTHLFTKPKYFKYKKPTINTEITGSGSDFALLISADCYVGGVALSFCDADAVFEDNYFDITSKSPLRISFSTKGSEAIDKLKRGLVIKSIYDIGK